MLSDSPVAAKHGINANTGISVGIVLVLLAGFAWVIKGQNDNSNATNTMRFELSGDIKELKTRMTILETKNNSWTSTDMFKWAVHLQQANPQIKVPEPEVNTK